MTINPYKIQPTEDWEIEDILIKEQEYANNNIQYLLVLLQKRIALFFHASERFHQSDGALVLYEYKCDTSNLTFNRSLYSKASNLIEEKLRKTITDINLMYDTHDINTTAIKNNNQFIAISPFLYDLKTWNEFISLVAKKHYRKELTAFKSKTRQDLKSTLNFLKIDKFWNLSNESHFFLDIDTYYRIEEFFNHHYVPELNSFNENDLESFKFQNSNTKIPKTNSKIYFDILQSISFSEKKENFITSFNISLSEDRLVQLYHKLEDSLDFFDINTTKNIWATTLLKKFSETESQRINFTPKFHYQVYYFFTLLSKLTNISIKEFYNSDRFLLNNEPLNYNGAKSNFANVIKKHNSFKGKQVLDSIFSEIK